VINSTWVLQSFTIKSESKKVLLYRPTNRHVRHLLLHRSPTHAVASMIVSPWRCTVQQLVVDIHDDHIVRVAKQYIQIMAFVITSTDQIPYLNSIIDQCQIISIIM
jgi:hypothetical protein